MEGQQRASRCGLRGQSQDPKGKRRGWHGERQGGHRIEKEAKKRSELQRDGSAASSPGWRAGTRGRDLGCRGTTHSHCGAPVPGARTRGLCGRVGLDAPEAAARGPAQPSAHGGVRARAGPRWDGSSRAGALKPRARLAVRSRVDPQGARRRGPRGRCAAAAAWSPTAAEVDEVRGQQSHQHQAVEAQR